MSKWREPVSKWRPEATAITEGTGFRGAPGQAAVLKGRVSSTRVP
jgi:hypothetical protein